MSWITKHAWATLKAATFGAVLTGAHTPATADSSGTTFMVGDRVLQGQPKTICVLEGTWADGEPLRYEAWDECSKMRVSPSAAEDYRDVPPLGDDDNVTAKDVPKDAEVLQVSNEFSTVLIFRDKAGKVQEVLVRD